MLKIRHSLVPAAVAVLALGLAGGAAAQAPASGPAAATAGAKTTLDRGDRAFVENAASGGMMEVQLGELAAKQASHADVKAFGSRMAQDHAKANDELKQIATSKGMSVPAAMKNEHRKEIERLQKLSGADFDREYMKHMVADHKKDLNEFEKQAKRGKDAELKVFAGKTVPTLKEHLQLAETTYAAVRKAK